VSAEAGRRPVLATLTAAQIPHLGPVPAVLGFSDGIAAAMRLVIDHGITNETLFAAALKSVRTDTTLDSDYSSSWAAGFALIRDAVPTLPTSFPIARIR
jgi:hypothetical protein